MQDNFSKEYLLNVLTQIYTTKEPSNEFETVKCREREKTCEDILKQIISDSEEYSKVLEFEKDKSENIILS